MQTDLNGYIGDSDQLQLEHNRAMDNLREEMREVELQYTHQETCFLKELQALRLERDLLAAAVHSGSGSGSEMASSSSLLVQDLSNMSKMQSSRSHAVTAVNRTGNVTASPLHPSSSTPSNPSGTVRRKVSINISPGDGAEGEMIPVTDRHRNSSSSHSAAQEGPAESEGTDLDGTYSDNMFFEASSESKVMDLEATMREIERKQLIFRQQHQHHTQTSKLSGE